MRMFVKVFFPSRLVDLPPALRDHHVIQKRIRSAPIRHVRDTIVAISAMSIMSASIRDLRENGCTNI